MSENRMKVGMVGVAGFGGARRELMRESGLFDLVAAYDWNADALERCRAEDGARPMESYEALLDVPGLEAIFISTGGKYHAEQGVAAAARGLHVFIEKPLCSTQEEVDALLAMQHEKGVVIGVGHHDHSRDALSRTIKHMIESGEIGAVTAVEKTTAHSGGLRIKPGDWRGDPEKNPGGMLFQCGVHALHELMYYFGPVSHVSCMMRYDVHTTGTADAAACNLRFASGLVGTLNAYHVTPYRHTMNIYGTKINLYRDERFFDEGTHLTMQRVSETNSKELREPVGPRGEDDPCGNLRSFHHAIRHGGEPYPSLRDGARAVMVVFAAEEAARTGGTVAVPAI